MTNRESRYNINDILELIRDNIFTIIIVSVLTFLVYYNNVFTGSDEVYYVSATAAIFFGLAVLIDKYRNPFRYDPPYFLFVKDRDEQLIVMEPFLDLLMTRLGFIKPEEFVNVRYTIYPELDVGLDMDPTSGKISGYPLEVGNRTSVVKMKFLGGEFSTKVRIEVVDTIRDKVQKVGEKFAPPRTVAQLLAREEDLMQRERDLDSRFDSKRKEMESEYVSKWRTLDEKFEVERLNFSDTLKHTEDTYERKLDEKEKRIQQLEDELMSGAQSKEVDFLERQNKLMEKLKASEERVAELELLSMETGAAAADLEEEYIEMFDALATGSDGEVVEEVKEEIKEEVKEEPEEEEPEEEEPEEEEPEEEEYDYVSMTKTELVELAEKRGLPTSGNKKEIISRLEGS